MTRRTAPLVILVLSLVVALAPPAGAATGAISDPAGEHPDIRRLSYDNAAAKVVMTMRFASLEEAQNQTFRMQWNDGAYEVLHFPSIPVTALYRESAPGTSDLVPCEGLRVTAIPDRQSTRAVVPRSCLYYAPNRLKFQGTAAGAAGEDETVLSPFVVRG